MTLDDLNPSDLIARFVVECRGRGHFLPYTDYEIIDEWLKYASDPDDLLIILADVLPEFYGDSASGGRPKPLSGVKKLVLSCLKERAMQMAGRPWDVS